MENPFTELESCYHTMNPIVLKQRLSINIVNIANYEVGPTAYLEYPSKCPILKKVRIIVQLGPSPNPKLKPRFWTKANTKVTFNTHHHHHHHPHKLFSRKELSQDHENSCVNLLRQNRMKDKK